MKQHYWREEKIHGINPAVFRALLEKGKEIPAELSKNFLSFPILDDPYKELGC